MKLALCGASGTGKTSIAEILSRELSIPMNPIGARSVAADMGLESPYDVDKMGLRKQFQRTLLTKKFAWERAHDSFVTDRTLADNVVYTVFHDVKAVDESMLSLMRESLEDYDVIVVCLMSMFFNTAGDQQRVEDRTYHYLFERTLYGLISSVPGAKEKTIIAPPGDAAFRARWIEGQLRAIFPLHGEAKGNMGSSGRPPREREDAHGGVGQSTEDHSGEETPRPAA